MLVTSKGTDRAGSHSIPLLHCIVLMHLMDFSAFNQGRELRVPVFEHAHQGLSENRSVLKGKNLLPKFFPLRVDHFSKGRQNNFDRFASLESVLVP